MLLDNPSCSRRRDGATGRSRQSQKAKGNGGDEFIHRQWSRFPASEQKAVAAVGNGMSAGNERRAERRALRGIRSPPIRPSMRVGEKAHLGTSRGGQFSSAG